MPLPPLGVDTYRKWAADRWKGVTDATIGRVQSGLWDVQATQAIDALGQQLARMRQQQEQAQEQERQRQEAVRAQLEEDRRRREEEAAQRRAALSSTVGGALGGVGERVGAGFSGIGQTAQRGVQGLQQTTGGWADRAEEAIGGLGGALGEFGESPSGQYLQAPAGAGPLHLRGHGRGRTSAGRRRRPVSWGRGLGALGAVPAGFGQLEEQAALGVGFTPEQARGPGARWRASSPPALGGLEQGGRRLGQVATAGLGGIGAAKGALETPGGLRERAGGALEGGLNWAQFGQPVGAVADLVRGVPYAFGRARGAVDDLAQRYGMPPDETLGVGRTGTARVTARSLQTQQAAREAALAAGQEFPEDLAAAAPRLASRSHNGVSPDWGDPPPGGWTDPISQEPVVPPRAGEPISMSEFGYWTTSRPG